MPMVPTSTPTFQSAALRSRSPRPRSLVFNRRAQSHELTPTPAIEIQP